MAAINVLIDEIAAQSGAEQVLVDAVKISLTQYGITTGIMLAATNKETINQVAAASAGATEGPEDVTERRTATATTLLSASEEREAQKQRAAVALGTLCNDLAEANLRMSMKPNLLCPEPIVKKLADNPVGFVSLGDFAHSKGSYEGRVETVTTIDGSVAQYRTQDNRKARVDTVGKWMQCFCRYAAMLQLVPGGRAAVDLGCLMSYACQVGSLFDENSVGHVLEAEEAYLRAGSLAVISGTISMSDLLATKPTARRNAKGKGDFSGKGGGKGGKAARTDASHGYRVSVTEKLRGQLEGWIDTLAGNPKLRDLFDQWVTLPRDRQGSCTQFPDLLDETTKRASEQLRETWCRELGVSGEAAPNTSLRPELMKALLMATSDHPDREDVGICDEVSRGCRVGIHEPVAATGLWPKDTKGPKHKGYGLSFWASKEAWYNYKSCEEMKSQVCAELEAEVVKGRMKKTAEPPAGAHLTKIACILKPNGKVRLVDDLRRSGINELVLCDETLALPGLKSAALAVETVSSQAPPGTEILWLETDVAAAAAAQRLGTYL
ncbi:hypothetical protein FOZ63_000315 [Perkinsus olseni]|uniref:Uncharacterized protein n=1 Tax=Perkinsus olseni TaxID=32597 RepID=A0A7J6P153_PEROL|nr:hypothetical protein FOZ62_008405 [Perkinsus olseni]KAF4730702.1 hypothetical protein FOZ63_000315 [Perkinsus olseni]